jgi:hypothetical protein
LQYALTFYENPHDFDSREDGPDMESYAASLDEALDWAAPSPAAASGALEVRPVWISGGAAVQMEQSA